MDQFSTPVRVCLPQGEDKVSSCLRQRPPETHTHTDKEGCADLKRGFKEERRGHAEDKTREEEAVPWQRGILTLYVFITWYHPRVRPSARHLENKHKWLVCTFKVFF